MTLAVEPLDPATLLDTLASTVAEAAAETLCRFGRCEPTLMAVIQPADGAPEVRRFDLLDPRLHLYAMQLAVRQSPEIYGFTFAAVGTVLLPISPTHANRMPALLAVWCTRETVVATARLLCHDEAASEFPTGFTLSPPEPAPESVVQHYRKVFTGEALPPSLHPM